MVGDQEYYFLTFYSFIFSTCDGGGGGGWGLHGEDLNIVSTAQRSGDGAGVEGGDARHVAAHGRRHDRGDGVGAEAEAGAGGGGGDVGVVADGAVGAGAPDADVVVLVGEVDLAAGHRGGRRVPVEAGDGAGGGCVVLEAVLLRHHQVPALVLRHLDLPLPRSCGGAGVYVDVDGVAGVGGGHPHVLARVVATDGGRDGTPGVGHGQGVRHAVPEVVAQLGCEGGGGVGVRQHHRVEVYPQFAHIRVGFAEGVGAGVRVRGDRVGGHDGVAVVGAAAAATGDGEHAAHTEGGGAGARGGAALARAFYYINFNFSFKCNLKPLSLI